MKAMTKNNKKLQEKYIDALKLMVKSEQYNNPLKANVAEWLLETQYNDYPIESVLNDLLSHGCQSGMVSGLIYTKDCQDFYDKYYDQIEDLIYDLEDSTGENVMTWNKSKIDRKNFLAWLGFEEMAREIANNLDIEV